MTIDLKLLRSLVAAGVSAAQLLAAVESMAASIIRKRERDADRLRKKRDEDDLVDIAESQESRDICDNPPESQESRDICDSAPPLPSSSPPHPPNNYPPPVGGGGDVRVISLILPATHKLTEQVATIAGLEDPSTWPPGWCGAAMQVQAWLNAGWTEELILTAVRGVMARKRDGPPTSAAYFAKAIARLVAEMQRPLPHADPMEVNRASRNQKPASMFAYLAQRRHDLQAEIEADSRRGDDPDVGMASSAD